MFATTQNFYKWYYTISTKLAISFLSKKIFVTTDKKTNKIRNYSKSRNTDSIGIVTGLLFTDRELGCIISFCSFPTASRIALINLVVDIYIQVSRWWMIIFWSLRWHRFPARLLVPVHVIVYVTRCVVTHTTPYAYVPLHAGSESFLPRLIRT